MALTPPNPPLPIVGEGGRKANSAFQILEFIEKTASPPLPALYLDKLGNRLSKGWKKGLGGEGLRGR